MFTNISGKTCCCSAVGTTIDCLHSRHLPFFTGILFGNLDSLTAAITANHIIYFLAAVLYTKFLNTSNRLSHKTPFSQIAVPPIPQPPLTLRNTNTVDKKHLSKTI